MAHSYSYLFNLPTTGLRFFTVYGPYGRPDMSPFKFAKAILEKKKIELNISKELEAIKKLTLNNLITLGENNIKNLNDLAELSSDELIEMLNTESLKKGEADEIIMKARENWFKEDKKENIKETSKK